MAVRAYWKGSLKLSLVSCPVLLYPASTSVEKTRFHMINKETGNRLKQQMVDAETGDVVESDQKGRGYELKKGEYVEIKKEELEAVQIESNHTIDIDSFVPRDEIDKRYLNHPYYIAPDGKAGIDAGFPVRRDIIRMIEVALVDLVPRHETIDLDGMIALDLDGFQLFLFDLDVIAFAHFVAAALLVALDDVAGLGVDHLLL